MDSFYGVPRQPPVAPKIDRFPRVPLVPEVSVIENRPQILRDYNRQPKTASNDDSFALLSRKQVRFEGNQENASRPNLTGKTFKQIYMANVPDRHLDLSIYDNPAPQEPIKKFNFINRDEDFSLRSLQKCNEISTQTETESCQAIAKNDEPTIKDLCKIIQQQNEQIMALQQQVNGLKFRPEIDLQPYNNSGNSPNKKGLISFNVKATSCEFSFRPPVQKFRKNDFLESKIQEIDTLQLNESVEVKDSYLSTVQQSIAIEMDKYSSSDDEEDPQIGLSFYKDLMKQVNNALKTAQKQSACQKPSELNGQAMKAVKQATIQHLQNIGVNLTPIQESTEVTDKGSLFENEVSGAVQQLLMKYLPPEKLAKVVNKPKVPQDKPSNEEFSFATLQYMRKYNLLGAGKNQLEVESVPKFLKNVTALKMQPKFPQN